MAPYLRDADLLWVEPLSQGSMPESGWIVLTGELGPSEPAVVHRHLGAGRTKGDRNRAYDSGMVVRGIVVGRMTSRPDGSLRFVSYDRWLHRGLRRLQSLLSRINEGDGRWIPRAAALALIVAGTLARKAELFLSEEVPGRIPLEGLST